MRARGAVCLAVALAAARPVTRRRRPSCVVTVALSGSLPAVDGARRHAHRSRGDGGQPLRHGRPAHRLPDDAHGRAARAHHGRSHVDVKATDADAKTIAHGRTERVHAARRHAPDDLRAPRLRRRRLASSPAATAERRRAATRAARSIRAAATAASMSVRPATPRSRRARPAPARPRAATTASPARPTRTSGKAARPAASTRR